MFGTPGGDTVVLIKRPAPMKRRLPTDPAPEDGERITKGGWLVEVQRPTEVTNLTTVDTEIAWAFGPIDADSTSLTPVDAIEHNGRVYEMQGHPVIEKLDDGEPVQVWCVVKWDLG